MDKRKWKYWLLPTIILFPTSTFWVESFEHFVDRSISFDQTMKSFDIQSTENTLIITNYSEKEIRKKFRNIEDKLVTLEEDIYLPEGEDFIVLPLYLSRMSGSILFGTHFVKEVK